MLVFTEKMPAQVVSMQEILSSVERAREFNRHNNITPEELKICRLEQKVLQENIEPFTGKYLLSVPGSERRKLSTLRVARSIASLQGEKLVSQVHIREALEWTSETFEKMKRWDL